MAIFSFEFFPPHTRDGANQLKRAANTLAHLQPHYFSVTFGAGGSTQEGTTHTVFDLMQTTPIEAAPHLSCIGSHKITLAALLEKYRAHNIKRIVALRGDVPSGMGSHCGELRYANELVHFIREQTGDHFHIEVAAYPEYHPQSDTANRDMENFKRKVDAGANSALTQYFYNIDAYWRFVDEAQKIGITIPIVPGIMPITNYKQLTRFSDACGAEIPRWIRRRLHDYAENKTHLLAFGHDIVSKLCSQLLEQGAPGLHFYTLNKAGPCLKLWQDLNLSHHAK